ncbi:MAG: hypothetical protein ABI614_28135 [Planctomycetota bacterium]
MAGFDVCSQFTYNANQTLNRCKSRQWQSGRGRCKLGGEFERQVLSELQFIEAEMLTMQHAVLRSLAIASLLLACLPARGQQGIQYDSIPEPYLFLLRESPVWDDLKLTAKQLEELQTFNARIDGPLLALRTLPNAEADKVFAELLSDSQTEVGRLFSREQQQRFTQIRLRVRGIECLQDDKVASALKLDATKRDAISSIVKEARTGIADLREQLQAGQPREPLEKEFTKLRSDEQRDILAELTPKQKEQFTALIGRSFDATKLGKISFKAPEIVAGGVWLNSQPVRLADLRGEVVALHFWTFG